MKNYTDWLGIHFRSATTDHWKLSGLRRRRHLNEYGIGVE
jgi:hypothetical protein